MLLSPGTEAPEIDSPLLASLPAKLLLPKTWHRHPGTGPLPPSSWVPTWPFSSSLRWTRALKFLGRAYDLAFLSGNWDWLCWHSAVGRCGHHPTPMLLEHSAFCLGSSKKYFSIIHKLVLFSRVCGPARPTTFVSLQVKWQWPKNTISSTSSE